MPVLAAAARFVPPPTHLPRALTPPPTSLAPDDRLRHEGTALLRGAQAHVDAHAALGGIPPDRVNDRADGWEHSLWDLMEHLRFAQADILEFVRGDYHDKDWPADYWPERDASADDWRQSRAGFFRDLDALVDLVQTADLTAELPHAPGYTVLRQVLLAADHNAYHLGQIVALRRLLGLWPPPER